MCLQVQVDELILPLEQKHLEVSVSMDCCLAAGPVILDQELSGRRPSPSSASPGSFVFASRWTAASPCRPLVPGGGRHSQRAGRCATEGKPAAAGLGCKGRPSPGRRGPDSQPSLCSLVAQRNGIRTNGRVKMSP